MTTNQPVTTQQSGFVAQPGQGWLLFNKRPSEDLALWQGSIKLANGADGQMQAKVIGGDKPHYEVEIKEIKPKGEPWPVVGQFKMKPFNGRRAQEVNIKGIGKAKVWTTKTRFNRNAIRIQILDAQLPDEPIL